MLDLSCNLDCCMRTKITVALRNFFPEPRSIPEKWTFNLRGRIQHIWQICAFSFCPVSVLAIQLRLLEYLLGKQGQRLVLAQTSANSVWHGQGRSDLVHHSEEIKFQLHTLGIVELTAKYGIGWTWLCYIEIVICPLAMWNGQNSELF